MNYELLEALNQIAREKNVDRDVLVETLIAGLLSAARRRYGLSANIDVHFDRDRGTIEARLIRRVVGNVEDPALEVSLEEAREQNAEAVPGAEHAVDLDVHEFGRNAVSTAKQVLFQRVREAERERIYAEFHGRVGELVHGVVQQIDRRSILLRVDGVEAVLPEREALHRDRFRQGDHVTAMLLEVDRMAKGPQVVLTRSHPDVLRRLFETEVPEIAERVVEIRSIAREAGSRSKVAVLSHDDRVDAVGACVGVKGSRVQNIVRELGGERIDIVPWSQDPALFVTRALSPAKVHRVDVEEEPGGVTVVVAEDQLSLAIGKGGQNVRLAMKLTGWSIELVSEEQLAEQREIEDVADFDLEEKQRAIGPKLTEKLIQAGLETASDVVNASTETLMAIEGVGPKSAEKVLSVVTKAYTDRLEQVRLEREAAEAEARAREAENAAAERAAAEQAAAEQAAAEQAAAEQAAAEAAAADEAAEARDTPEEEVVAEEEVAEEEVAEEETPGEAPDAEAGASGDAAAVPRADGTPEVPPADPIAETPAGQPTVTTTESVTEEAPEDGEAAIEGTPSDGIEHENDESRVLEALETDGRDSRADEDEAPVAAGPASEDAEDDTDRGRT